MRSLPGADLQSVTNTRNSVLNADSLAAQSAEQRWSHRRSVLGNVRDGPAAKLLEELKAGN